MPAIFEGHYKSFDEIVEADQYDAVDIIPRIYQLSLSRYKENFFFPKAIPNEYNHIRDITSLVISLLCAETKNTINILDVGGGFGASYIELIKRCQLENFNYTVCEIQSFFEHYEKNPFFKQKNIKIIQSVEEINEPQQLLIFSSSLQYFSDYAESLKNIVKNARYPKYILLTHTPITALPGFATTQINIDNKKLPNWIFNVDSLITIFLESNYDCIFKSAVYREGLFDDFKNEKENYRSMNCLFRKRNQ
ncbi:MAG: methyltransferase, TIGR04325 family [Gammaproteobacteria bacterium]|nr:methyltransferase, TIGR04325 family [Gammaproteobacteria bacterium]